MRLYKTGLVIGRFQPLHKGHEFLIKRALSLCDIVYIYVGSAQEGGTEVNPYSYYDRKLFLLTVFGKEFRAGRIVINPLYDQGLGNCPSWGQYVLDTFKADNGCLPDLYITGCEKERSSWFTNEIAPNMDELRLTRHNIVISGTECRIVLKQGQKDIINKYISKNVYKVIKGEIK